MYAIFILVLWCVFKVAFINMFLLTIGMTVKYNVKGDYCDQTVSFLSALQTYLASFSSMFWFCNILPCGFEAQEVVVFSEKL